MLEILAGGDDHVLARAKHGAFAHFIEALQFFLGGEEIAGQREQGVAFLDGVEAVSFLLPKQLGLSGAGAVSPPFVSFPGIRFGRSGALVLLATAFEDDPFPGMTSF